MHMRYAAVSVVVVLLLCSLAPGLWADSVVDDLLPRPQQIKAGNGTSDLDWKTAPLLLSTPFPEATARLEARLRETAFGQGDRAVASQTGKAYALGIGHGDNSILPTTIETTGDTEAYRLVISPTEILIESASERGLFYGMMTLDQLVRGATLRGEEHLPLLEIRDWPAISMRGPHEDFGRDQLPTMDDLKRSIRIAAQFKMNTYCWFIESDHFVYDFDPNISTEYDRFTFDEIREFVAYAKDYYIEVIPVVELLAHMEGTLNHDRYKHLTETGEGGGTLCPTCEESFALVKNMIDEIAPAFGGRYFHCGLDESQVVGSGRSAGAIAEKGIEQVYADYYTRVNEAVKAHGQTMIMYADIVLNHPGILELLPKDIVMMFWDYMPQDRYAGLDKLKEMGYPVMALSGMWDWNNLYPVYPPGFENMQSLAKQSAEVGAIGHFVSDWGDGYRGVAGINLSELNHYGFIYCGVVSWNPDAPDLDGYSGPFARDFFGSPSPQLASALTRLARCQGDDLNHNTWARRILHDDVRQRVLEMMGQDEAALAFWKNLRKEAEAAGEIIAESRPTITRNEDYLKSIGLAADLLACAANMALVYHDVAQAIDKPDEMDRALRGLKVVERYHRALWENYRDTYAATNRPLNLNHIGPAWLRTSDEMASLAGDIASGAFPPKCEKKHLAIFSFDGDGDAAWKAKGVELTLVPMADRPQATIVEGGPSGDGAHLHIPLGGHLEATDGAFALDLLYCPLLIEAWVRHNGQREQQYGATIFSYGLGGGYRLGLNHKGEVLFTLYGIGETAATNSIIPPDGQWHHVAVNFHEGRLVDHYIDGVFTEQLQLPGIPRHPHVPLIRIGNEIALVTPFEGDIDRIRISRGVYTAEELDAAAGE